MTTCAIVIIKHPALVSNFGFREWNLETVDGLRPPPINSLISFLDLQQSALCGHRNRGRARVDS